MPGKEKILGIKADIFMLEEAIARAAELLKQGGPSLVVSINPEIVMMALYDTNLKEMLNSADMALPDGVGILFTSWLKGGRIRHRVTGIDLMEKLLQLASEKKYRTFFLGAEPGVAGEAAEQAKLRFPGLQIAGTHHGFFSPLEEKAVVEKIAASEADILFIGMGANRQERFMFQHSRATGARLLMVVGGSLDVLSGRKKRAPSWIQNLGVEWLYRALQEPRRFRRILVLPAFLKENLTPRRGERFRLLGVQVDKITYKDAIDKVKLRIQQRKPLWIVAVNPEKIIKAWENPEIRTLMHRSELAIPDGVGILFAGWIMAHSFPQRVTGVDLFLRLVEQAAQEGWKIYLLGAIHGVAEEAAARLAQDYPGLKIAGTHHGYFTPQEEPHLVNTIAALQPDLLFIALGSPKQERFIDTYLEQLQVPVCMGIGGTLDVISGRVKRAPRWMQESGLEWSYRLWREPKRALRLLALPRFLWLLFLYRLGFYRNT